MADIARRPRLPTLVSAAEARRLPAIDTGGQLVRVHRSWHVRTRSADLAWLTRQRVHLARGLALRLAATNEPTFCLDSAALMWGLRVWRLQPTPAVARAHVANSSTRRRARSIRTTVTTGARTSVSLRCEDEACPLAHDLRVTTLERTLADCARMLPALDALVVADSGYALGLDCERARAALDATPTNRGLVKARAVLAAADAGSESAGESVVRWLCISQGLPPPQTQMVIATHRGEYRGDVGYSEWRVLFEVDGRVKYTGTRADRLAALTEAHSRRRPTRAMWRLATDVAEGGATSDGNRHN